MSTTVELAFKYGPFLFGIFLVLTAAKLVKKGSTPRGLLWLFSISGILFMMISVGWWLRQPGISVFEGTLRNLTSYEQLSSDDPTFFYREELKKSMGDDEEKLRNVRFVVVRRGALAAHDAFLIEYRKKGGPRETFRVPFSPGLSPSYVIVWDTSAGKNLLKPANEVITWWPEFAFEHKAFAQEAVQELPADRASARVQAMPTPPPPPRPQATRQPRGGGSGASPTSAAAAVQAPTGLNSDTERLVTILQDGGSDVGAKIAVLDKLNQYDDGGIRVLMKAATDTGPVAATLLDLARHSDAELAAKARNVINRYDLSNAVVSALLNKDTGAQKNARVVLGSMDQAQAQAVLAKLPPPQRNVVQAPIDGQPFPTGSRQGDRYYVKATWDRQAEEIVKCLTHFFNEVLVSNRTLADEQKLMRNRKDRTIYGSSRDQASDMAAQIRSCGATPSFVVPWKS